MISHLIALTIGFIAGALVFKNNVSKANDIIEKGKDAVNKIKSK